MMKENKENFQKLETTQNGDDLNISEGAITSIISLVASEIDGISGFCGGIVDGIGGFFSKKNQAKGIKTFICDKKIIIDMSIIIKNGYSIPKISKKIKEEVKKSVETMTGYNVVQINIYIDGIEC